MLKSNILDVYSRKYIKLKIDSDDELSLEKTLNMHSVVICSKLFSIKDLTKWINTIQMLYEKCYYYRTDVSKGINFNKTHTSKECITCYYPYFLDKKFRNQSNFCNSWHDVSKLPFGDTAILNINGVDWYCIIFGISKNEAIKILENPDLNKKVDFGEI